MFDFLRWLMSGWSRYTEKFDGDGAAFLNVGCGVFILSALGIVCVTIYAIVKLVVTGGA